MPLAALLAISLLNGSSVRRQQAPVSAGVPAAAYCFDVKVTGQGPAVILIPGLTCGGGVWDDTVQHLKSRYTCHVLTLPGFAGKPSIGQPFLPKVKDDVERYVADKRLTKPILIGHSLGGMLSIWLAEDKPDMFGGLISVDGLPYLGALYDPKGTPASNQKAATAARDAYAGMTQEKFKTGNEAGLPQMITKDEDIARVAAQSDLSDPKAVGQAVYEMLTIDLRPDVSKIKCPYLQMMSGAQYPAKPYMMMAQARYESQIALDHSAKLLVAVNAKHFIMIDDPEFFYKGIDAFLANVPAGPEDRHTK